VADDEAWRALQAHAERPDTGEVRTEGASTEIDSVSVLAHPAGAYGTARSPGDIERSTFGLLPKVTNFGDATTYP